MDTTYPRVKSTLKVQVETVEGVNYYNVKESEGGKFIRLREPEYFLLNASTEPAGTEDAAVDFVRNYNKQITPEAVSSFVQKLAELGFLEGPVQANGQTGFRALYQAQSLQSGVAHRSGYMLERIGFLASPRFSVGLGVVLDRRRHLLRQY